ncbi:hypothetical protein KKB64_02805 [Patescibacteria group bacterium]|nr:hypothetical protein [Patescibacteria group bacterium]MBU2460133.1 hypothetical protein [Patescibacteria group bacterium]MBU2544386.1 hypothetical protein [Patescibacteria group bacterium]
MKQNRINFVALLKPYKKGWVAISEDFKHVLFYGKSLTSLIKKSKKSKQKVYYFPSGDNYSNFVGYYAHHHSI